MYIATPFLLVRMHRRNSLEKRVALTHTLLSKIETAARAAASTGGFHTGVDDTFSKGMQFYCQAITNTKTIRLNGNV